MHMTNVHLCGGICLPKTFQDTNPGKAITTFPGTIPCLPKWELDSNYWIALIEKELVKGDVSQEEEELINV